LGQLVFYPIPKNRKSPIFVIFRGSSI
jgi:hypothetical protein